MYGEGEGYYTRIRLSMYLPALVEKEMMDDSASEGAAPWS